LRTDIRESRGSSYESQFASNRKLTPGVDLRGYFPWVCPLQVDHLPRDIAFQPASGRWRLSRVTTDGLLDVLRLLSIVLVLAVSPAALTALGSDYQESQGTLLGKIHPATYIMLLTLLVLACRAGPSRFLASTVSRHPGAVALAWGVATLLAYDVLFIKAPLSSLVDTFVSPIAALIVFDRIGPGDGRKLSNLLHAIFLANGLLALFEMASGWRLTPLVVDGELLENETRSSALMGQPLANAIMTGAYIIILARGGDRALPTWLRGALIALQLAAMVPMGGRAASLATLGILSVLALRQLALLLMGKRFTRIAALAVVLIVPAAIAVMAIAYDQGFFDILIDRFNSDNRSAETRVIMFQLFSHFPWFELLFGPDQQQLASLMWTEGTEYGIESFPVALCLTYGILPASMLMLGLAIFAFDVIRSTRPGAAISLAFFFVVAATSLSLGGKTVGLASIVIMNMVLLRREAPITSTNAPQPG